jgi:hypothetical protein
MKRNMDLIRALLLKLERSPIRPGGIVHLQPSDPEIAVDGFSDDEIEYHLSLLEDVRLLECSATRPMIGLMFKRLSWSGHDFLDSIRDDEIWHKTKKAAEATGELYI